MKEQQQNLIDYIKSIENLRACITGSCLLDEYFEGSDVDVFAYDLKAFTKLYYTLVNNSLFQILDPLEDWKAKNFENKDEKPFSKFGLVTIKMVYNTCIPINIILKKDKNSVFDIVSSFDMDIICKGYCLQSKQYLDLTGNSTVTKIASWNRWNNQFTSGDIWDISRILRQLERCFKYESRSYNCDAVVEKYLELTENIEKYESIFNSENFNEKLAITKHNTEVIKNICKVWLATHKISDNELQLLKESIKLL